MDERLRETHEADIREKFFPILTSIVRGARVVEFSLSDVQEFTKTLLQLNAYFENRNWNVVWNSEAVKSKWRELWLSKNSDNTFPVHQWFDVEKPTIPHLDAGLELYARCMSLEVP